MTRVPKTDVEPDILDTAEDVAVLAEAETPLLDMDARLRDEVAAVRTLLGTVHAFDISSLGLSEQRDRLLARVPAPDLSS